MFVYHFKVFMRSIHYKSRFFLLPQIRSNTFYKYPKADCLNFEIKCLIFGNDGQENYCVSFLFKLSNQRKRLRVYATKLSSSAS